MTYAGWKWRGLPIWAALVCMAWGASAQDYPGDVSKLDDIVKRDYGVVVENAVTYGEYARVRVWLYRRPNTPDFDGAGTRLLTFSFQYNRSVANAVRSEDPQQPLILMNSLLSLWYRAQNPDIARITNLGTDDELFVALLSSHPFSTYDDQISSFSGLEEHDPNQQQNPLLLLSCWFQISTRGSVTIPFTKNFARYNNNASNSIEYDVVPGSITRIVPDAVSIQQSVNAVLGNTPYSPLYDTNADGTLDAADVQGMINAALGLVEIQGDPRPAQ